MESSDPSVKTPLELPTQRWAGILGVAIAILTLVVPTFAIAYYSSLSPKDFLSPTTDRPPSSQEIISV